MSNKDGEFNLYVDPSTMGAEIRGHLIDLQNIFSIANETLDNSTFVYDEHKSFIEEAEIIAEEQILEEQPKLSALKIKSKIKTWDVIVDKDTMEIKTMLELKRELNTLKLKVSRAKSRAKEVEKALDTYRSVLSWDKEDLANQ